MVVEVGVVVDWLVKKISVCSLVVDSTVVVMTCEIVVEDSVPINSDTDSRLARKKNEII